jgi:hypothetical protein
MAPLPDCRCFLISWGVDPTRQRRDKECCVRRETVGAERLESPEWPGGVSALFVSKESDFSVSHP